MGLFKKRVYSPRLFASDMAYLIKNVGLVAPLTKGQLISPAFRERLMLVITAVNQCRYCAAAHGALGRKAGIPDNVVAALLDGSLDQGPEEERPALHYAQTWAMTDGHPELEAREQLLAEYGPEKTALIEFVIRTIRVGNLSGNTLDAILHKISAGRLALL